MSNDFTYFACKQCGRAMKTKEKPNNCYFDFSNQIENIGDEDAVKMQLFSTTEGVEIDGIIYEFPEDIRFHPFTGEIMFTTHKGSLHDFQNTVMKRVTK